MISFYKILCFIVLLTGSAIGYYYSDKTLDIISTEFSESSSTHFPGVVNGPWRTFMNLGRPEMPMIMKALVARIGIGALTSDEALFWMTSNDSQGNPLHSSRDYRITLPATSLHKEGGVWSLSLYDEDGYYIENDAQINSLGSRDNLEQNEDGSITIIISYKRRPGVNNWFPAPKDKPFNLTLRVYLPSEEMKQHPKEVALPVIKEWKGQK